MTLSVQETCDRNSTMSIDLLAREDLLTIAHIKNVTQQSCFDSLSLVRRMVRAWQTGDNLGFSAIGWPARSRLRSRGSELTADLWWKLRLRREFLAATPFRIDRRRGEREGDRFADDGEGKSQCLTFA